MALYAHLFGDAVRTLDRERPAVVQRFHAGFPCLVVNLVEIPLAHICGEKHIHRLALADERGPIGRVRDNPPLVQLERGFENVFLVIRQEVQMLDRTLGDGDIGPDFRSVLPLFSISACARARLAAPWSDCQSSPSAS